MAFQILSPSEQVAAHLRGEILKNRWKSKLPGTPALASEMGVDRKTVIAALGQLEEEGLLQSQGPGRSRKIVFPEGHRRDKLNINLLLYEDADRQLPIVLDLVHRIEAEGYHPNIVSKTFTRLSMDPERVRKFVESQPADAWIVCSASRPVLEWFSGQKFPAFAIFGRRRQVDIASAGPDKVKALQTAVRKLVALGHRRIVYLARMERREPDLGFLEKKYLEELEAQGVRSGSYNLPEWEDNPESFHDCLERLFRFTPPTAIITDEVQFFISTEHYLAQRDIVSPRDVSLMCCDSHPIFDWCRPEVTHIGWDAKPVVDETMKWISGLAKGRNIRKTTFTPARFVLGKTSGPAPK